MAVSVSALMALAAVVFAGPLACAVSKFCRKGRRRVQASGKAVAGLRPQPSGVFASGEREETDTVSYMMTLLGYAIGIGNLWRFPYLVGKWGGGAFMIAYLCSLVFVACPLYLLEIGMGHHLRKSTLDCLRAIHPRFLGLGVAQTIMMFMVLTYFNVLIAYCGVYLASALLDPLPWSPEAMSPTAAGGGAAAGASAEDFWRRDVLNEYPGDLHGLGFGPLQWNVVIALFFVYVIVFLSLAFGKKVLAKVTWIMVVGPLVLLMFVLFKAMQLEGAGDGVRFYVGKCDWELLKDVELWATACSQILFSLSPGFGTAMTMSSYVSPHTDVFRTCMLVSLCNSAFSVIGGFAIFGILGNLSFRTGRTVAEVASASGPGLAFIAIADGIRTFGEGSNVMAVLFFLMLMALGLDSTFAWAETAVCVIQDHFVRSGQEVSKTAIVGAVSVALFLLGLPYCTRMGAPLLDIVDHFVGSMFLMFSCFVEAVMFLVCYKFRRLELGLQAASGYGMVAKPFWKLCLWGPAPAAPGFLFAYLVYAAVKTPYGPDGGYPQWLLGLGWALMGTCMFAVLSTAFKRGSTSLEPLDALDTGALETESEEDYSQADDDTDDSRDEP